MRIPGQHNRQPALQGEAMTPMIDVVFLLLVFFVCASVGQLPDSLLPAELGPGTTTSDVVLPPPNSDRSEQQIVRIALRPGKTPGNITMQLNSQFIQADDLGQRLIQLSKIDPTTRIILDIDDGVPNQPWFTLYKACQTLHFQSISFGVRNGSDSQS
ncbi:MAG: biopolymer transporter ExbD [Fuerstiella sp.]|nr:biopolymer transporter ExbD [Fuerstiella sp.]